MYMNFKEAFERVDKSLPQEARHVTFRYDDTNPEVESQEFVDKLAEAVHWLGWTPSRTTYTSDYFQQMFDLALKLIDMGSAYVCHQTGDEIERSRAIARALHVPETLISPDLEMPESPWRNTSPAENRKKFMDMKRGLYREGEASLRMKIDMRHTNPNLWDPVAYRVIFHAHPHTKDAWCVYPTYDFSHCIVDSLEDIDYSICTVEFETRRESYYWLLWKLDLYRPKVFEFARLELTQTLMSKRKLKKLVEDGSVRGWDDPRMPTLMGMRRRGFSKDSINRFMSEIGITRASSTVDVKRFNAVVQHDLDEHVPRAFGVLHPVPLILTNIPESFIMTVDAPLYPQKKEDALASMKRKLHMSRTVYVDEENVREQSSDDFYGLVPGKFVRLRYSGLVECTRILVDPQTKRVVSLEGVCWFDAAQFSPDAVALNPASAEFPLIKPKGVLHWISSPPGTSPLKCQVRLYDHLIRESNATPGEGEQEDELNPSSEVVVENAFVERDFIEGSIKAAKAAHAGKLNGGVAEDEIQRFQLERVGFFCLDVVDCKDMDHVVLNRILPLNVSAGAATGSAPANKNPSRKEEKLLLEAAKAERLKYSVSDYFKRPGELEKWEEFDSEGFPMRAKGEATPISKSSSKNLKKELEKHKAERVAKGFSD